MNPYMLQSNNHLQSGWHIVSWSCSLYIIVTKLKSRWNIYILGNQTHQPRWRPGFGARAAGENLRMYLKQLEVSKHHSEHKIIIWQ